MERTFDTIAAAYTAVTTVFYYCMAVFALVLGVRVVSALVAAAWNAI